jgi:transposase-like protein
MDEAEKQSHGKRYSLARKLAIKARVESGESVSTIAREEQIGRRTVYDVMRDARVKLLDKNQVSSIKRSLIGDTYSNAWRAQQKITDAKLDASSALQLMTISAIGIDKGRLMEGLSTENVSHRGVVENIDNDRRKLMDEITKLREEK